MAHKITLIPGDGIGPEITYAAKDVIESTGVKIDWIVKEAGAKQIELYNTPLPEEVLNSVRSTEATLKGPITTPVGKGFRSVNVILRREMDMYVNLRPTRTFLGVPSRFDNVDIVVIRENTEDLYMGVEHMAGPDVAESIKIFTRNGCRRIVKYAFEYARANNRKKVTAVHKANIMKLTDGMFLEVARQVAQDYPDIEFEDVIIDAMCMKLVTAPEKYDVLVLPNLYGDIVSDLCAGLVGGLGLAPSANIGDNGAIFEAIHGSAPDIAGKNIANPTALILSGAMMLRHIGETSAAIQIENAVKSIIAEGKALTRDLGGTLNTDQYAKEIIKRL